MTTLDSSLLDQGNYINTRSYCGIFRLLRIEFNQKMSVHSRMVRADQIVSANT